MWGFWVFKMSFHMFVLRPLWLADKLFNFMSKIRSACKKCKNTSVSRQSLILRSESFESKLTVKISPCFSFIRAKNFAASLPKSRAWPSHGRAPLSSGGSFSCLSGRHVGITEEFKVSRTWLHKWRTQIPTYLVGNGFTLYGRSKGEPAWEVHWCLKVLPRSCLCQMSCSFFTV